MTCGPTLNSILNTMRIHILIGQRTCSYPEQYAPEVLAAIDQNSLDDGNSEWLHEKEAEAKKSNEFSGLRQVIVLVPDKDIDALFTAPTIQGQVQTP